MYSRNRLCWLVSHVRIARKMMKASNSPPESTKVQIKAEEVIQQTAAILTRLFDVTATKDWTNCVSRADVVMDGQTLLAQVPVTYLLFLEKQLVDLHTFVKKLPTLDASETWTFDASADCWATEAVQTVKTKKIPRNHVKAEATDNHPAQCVHYTQGSVYATVYLSECVVRPALLQQARKREVP